MTPRAATGGRWQVEDAADLYGIAAWGNDYFAIGADGNLKVRPRATSATEIDLAELTESLAGAGFTSPIVVRFADILAHRLQRLNDAFADAIAENDYRGRHVAVYPMKVNQQRAVVDEVRRRGRRLGFGLEVGSKPELLAVLALTSGDGRGQPVICNGFKDSAYIRAVLLATKLGRNIVPVLDSLHEARLVVRHAARHRVRPSIGVRIKLAGRGSGRWQASCGPGSKFGLSATEVLQVCDLLREHDLLDCLRLVHCHPGSQVQDIGCIKDAVGELAHVYAELVRLGASPEYVDVGGGLGVDYIGRGADQPSSMSYTLEEYASEVVYRLASVCDDRGIAHPTIVSESGRAIAAYHSVVVFDVLAAGRALDDDGVAGLPPSDDVEQPVWDLFEAYELAGAGRIAECCHDAVDAYARAMELFRLGYLPLEQRALAERLFRAITCRVRAAARHWQDLPDELLRLRDLLCDTYFCNLSVFHSLPDAWAIGQLFPIMPVQRLDERPMRRGVLADVTCDPAGRVGRFAGSGEARRWLDLHEIRDGEPYRLAAFLAGAYQESLGDLHNLFGDPHVAHVHLDDGSDTGWRVTEIREGDSIAEVLAYVQYGGDHLLARIEADCELAVRDGRLARDESRFLKRFYEEALDGYTYPTVDAAADAQRSAAFATSPERTRR